MTISKTVVCLTFPVALALNALMHAQNKDSEGIHDSCRLFAQESYDWYLPNTHVKEAKKNGMPGLQFALKIRRSASDPDLVRQLD